MGGRRHQTLNEAPDTVLDEVKGDNRVNRHCSKIGKGVRWIIRYCEETRYRGDNDGSDIDLRWGYGMCH